MYVQRSCVKDLGEDRPSAPSVRASKFTPTTRWFSPSPRLELRQFIAGSAYYPPSFFAMYLFLWCLNSILPVTVVHQSYPDRSRTLAGNQLSSWASLTLTVIPIVSVISEPAPQNTRSFCVCVHISVSRLGWTGNHLLNFHVLFHIHICTLPSGLRVQPSNIIPPLCGTLLVRHSHCEGSDIFLAPKINRNMSGL